MNKSAIKTKVSGKNSTQSPQKRAWATRRANNLAKQKPTIIEFNGLTIEIHAPMLGRILTIQNDNLIKII
jgi:hypothetical protein